MIAVEAADPSRLERGLRAEVGTAVSSDIALRNAHAVGGAVPALVVRPQSREELAVVVARIAEAGAALVPLGLGAHRTLGHPPRRYDVAVVTTALAGILDYTPADMTITLEAGAPFAAVQDLLAHEGQWLPLEPPLPAATTIGGIVACDPAGPLRASQGRARDFLIGVAAVTAGARVVRGGGKVVKNVAGYDLMKLLTGSLGTLAIVTEATLKVRPRPESAICIIAASRSPAAAIDLATAVADARVDPLAAPVVVALGGAEPPRLVCRLAGVDADVAAARARVREIIGASGAELTHDGACDAAPARTAIDDVRDFVRTAPGDLVLRAAALPRRAAALALAWLADFADLRGRCHVDPRSGDVTIALAVADPAHGFATAASAARTHGAHLVVERWPAALASTIDVWTPFPPALALMQRMKATLDPAGVLAPGRFVARI